MSVNNNSGAGAAANNIGKKVIFNNCAPFTNCISKINSTQISNSEYIDIVMPCITYIAITIQKHLEAYGNIVKKYRL